MAAIELDNWLKANAKVSIFKCWTGAGTGLGISMNSCPVSIAAPPTKDDYFMVETTSGDIDVSYR